MLKLILSFWLLLFVINLQSQNIDSLIAGIEYSIAIDTSSAEAVYIFSIKNKSKKDFITQEFGINANKIKIHNSSDEKIDYDFIACGIFEQIIIKPDSSYSWKTEVLKSIPFFPLSFAGAIKKERVDSMYLVYWIINQHVIGPVNYYIEKDLVTKLSNANNITRDKCAKMLRHLHDKGLISIKVGHSMEHSLAYWENKYAALEVGLSVFEINKKTDLNLSRECRIGRFPDTKIQLDNSFLLSIEYNDSNQVKNYGILYCPKIAQLAWRTVSDGKWNSYYINGQFASKKFFFKRKHAGEQLAFNRNGKLISKSIYENNKRISSSRYNEDGVLQSKTIYLDRLTRKVIYYDADGKVVRDELVKLRKRRYK